MKKELSLIAILALAWGLIAGPAEAKKNSKRVTGSLVRVEQQVRAEDGTDLGWLTVRTRHGEEVRLRLVGLGDCSDCFRVGDRVRAHLRQGTEGQQGRTIHRMQLRRDGRIYDFTFDGNKMVRQLSRHQGSHRGHDAHRTKGNRGGSGS